MNACAGMVDVPRLAGGRPAGAGAMALRANVSWAFAGNTVNAACQWGVLVLLIHALPKAQVGRFVFALALTSPIFVLANVRLRNLLATGVASPSGAADYLRARLGCALVAFAVCLAAAAVFAPAPGDLLLVALLAGAKALDAVSDICHGVFQRGLELRKGAIGLMVNGAVSLMLVWVCVSLGGGLRAAVAAYAVGSLVALAMWDLPNAARMTQAAGEPFIRPALKLTGHRDAGALIRRAAPLGVSSALGTVQASLPRFAIAALLGPGPLAVFAALAYFNAPVAMILNAVGQAALPALAKDVRLSVAAYTRRLKMLVVGGVSLGLAALAGTAVFGRRVVALVYTAEYADHTSVLLLLVAASAVTGAYLFLGTAATARQRYGAQLGISILSTATLAALLWPLVSAYGLTGAGWAVVLASMVDLSAYVALTAYDGRRPGRAFMVAND